MAAKTCKEVVDGETYAKAQQNANAEPTKDSIITIANEKFTEFLNIFNDASAAIQKSATALYDYDCSEHLYDWVTETCPWLKTGMSVVDSVVNKLNAISSGTMLSDLMSPLNVTDGICDGIAGIFGTIEGWLELLTKTAFVMFSKIDDARKKLEKAIRRLTNATLDCILDVYDAIESYLTKSISLSLAFDWREIIQFMKTCPCVSRFISWMFGCDEDENGNSISDNPDEIVRCIKEKFSFLDASQLAAGLSALMDKYIRSYIVLFFDFIKFGITFIFTMIIAPFRWLIKKYAEFLQKKWDAGWVIKPAKSVHLDCFLIYSKEFKDGEEFYGMSILDMLASFRRIVPCLAYACPGLSEKVKNRVKQHNKELRLDDKFWNRQFEADIYSCCIEAEGEQGYTWEELRAMWDALWDKLVSKTQKANNAVAAVKAEESLGSFDSEIANITNIYRNADSGDGTDGGDNTTKPYSSAADMAYGSDFENAITNGTKYISSSNEKKLISVAGSVSAGAKSDDYFTEKWYQLLRFKAPFHFSKGGMGELESFGNDISKPPAPDFSRHPDSNFKQILIRPRIEFDPSEREANYYVESDYNEARVKKITGLKWNSQREGESLAGYYARMYSMV